MTNTIDFSEDVEIFRFSGCLYVLHDDYKNLLTELKETQSKLKRAEKCIEDYDNCIEWALGYDCILEPTFDPPADNRPRYWWRKDLAAFREKAIAAHKEDK